MLEKSVVSMHSDNEKGVKLGGVKKAAPDSREKHEIRERHMMLSRRHTPCSASMLRRRSLFLKYPEKIKLEALIYTATSPSMSKLSASLRDQHIRKYLHRFIFCPLPSSDKTSNHPKAVCGKPQGVATSKANPNAVRCLWYQHKHSPKQCSRDKNRNKRPCSFVTAPVV